jgi:hypothetical protein
MTYNDYTILKMKIDIVYTYVDGTDKQFITKKNKYMTEYDIPFNDNIRFESINEIVFSIQTILKFAKWINTIFIVTDNQIPPIQQELITSGKVVIIDHKDIIPDKYLPTFYSDVIESYLHNIPNLSDVFLYNNDDFFFLNYVYKKDLFAKYTTNKKNNIKFNIINDFDINVFIHGNNEYCKRIVKTNHILNTITDKKLINNHYTKILRKSTLKIIEINYAGLLEELRKYKFRNTESIQYLFFAINIDNIIYNNNIIDNNTNAVFHDLGGNDYNHTVSHKFNIHTHTKYKFACFNNMNHSYKTVFANYIQHILKQPIKNNQ